MTAAQPRPPRVLQIGVDDSILHPDNRSRLRNIAGIAERVGRTDWILYSPRGRGYERTVLAGNATIHPTRSLTKLHFFRDAFRMGCRLHDEHGYDLICAQDPMGSGLVGHWLRRRCGRPLLLKCHSDYYGSEAWRSESLRYRLFDHRLSVWLLRRADHVQVVSPQLAQDVARLGVDPERITVLPTIVQTYLFEPGADSPERYGAGRLLFVGRLARQKDIPTLLGAMRLLADRGRECRLTVVGGGPQRKNLLELRDRLGVDAQVEFISHKPREKLAELYRQSSIFVIASVHEAFGKVIVEAGLCGLPIVGTAVGGIPWHVVDGENGLLVPPRDPDALATAIARLLDDPALARTMGRETQRRFRDKWSYEDMLDAHIDLLKRVAGGAVH